MKTKNLFPWNILLITLGCFLFTIHSSSGMFSEAFWEQYQKEKEAEVAQQQAEQQQRERDLTAPGSQGNSSSAFERGTLDEGNGPSEKTSVEVEQESEDQMTRVIIRSYLPSLTQEEENNLVDEIKVKLLDYEQLLGDRALTNEDKIVIITSAVASKAGVQPPATAIAAAAAYQQAEKNSHQESSIIKKQDNVEDPYWAAVLAHRKRLAEERFVASQQSIISVATATAIVTHLTPSSALAQQAERLSLGSTSSEGKNSQPATPPGGVKKTHTDSDASEQLERLSKEGHSDGSTSGEDSHHSTPEKIIPSISPLPALTEVESLQEEARHARTEMEKAEDFWKNAKKRSDEAHKKEKDAIRQSSNPSYYASESWQYRCADYRKPVYSGDPFTAEEQKLSDLLKDYLEKYNIFAYKEKENAQAYSLARNHYLDLEKQLYIAQKKANPPLTRSLILDLCERHISFVLREIGQTEEQLLKYKSYIGNSGKRYPDCDRELSQIKEHIPNLWNHYLFLARERYDTQPSFIRPSTPYVPSTAEQTELTKLQQQLVEKLNELDSHRELVSQLGQQEQKVNSDLTNNTKALQKFKTDHPYGAGFGILKSSLNLLTEQGNLEKWYNYSLRAKQDFDRISKPKLQAAREAIDRLESWPSYLRREIETLQHKLTKYPEERIIPLEEAFFRQWPLQEQFSRYWHALNALITFDDSLPRMYDDLKYTIISREAEEHYKTYAPILESYKFSLLAPQEQGHPERFVAHGMSTSEIVKLALERKKEYDSHEAFMKRSCGGTINCFATAYTPSYTREQAAQDWWRREGQQQAIRQQQAANTAWNIQQGYMVQNAMANGTLYFPLYK